ncbi:hypothetical protein BDR07DRAFT_1409769 [Suillus spraguei]|nr:hypothetical protein BDR07DRAFT_1409769 [Suillus spraguei]
MRSRVRNLGGRCGRSLAPWISHAEEELDDEDIRRGLKKNTGRGRILVLVAGGVFFPQVSSLEGCVGLSGVEVRTHTYRESSGSMAHRWRNITGRRQHGFSVGWHI